MFGRNCQTEKQIEPVSSYWVAGSESDCFRPIPQLVAPDQGGGPRGNGFSLSRADATKRADAAAHRRNRKTIEDMAKNHASSDDIFSGCLSKACIDVVFCCKRTTP